MDGTRADLQGVRSKARPVTIPARPRPMAIIRPHSRRQMGPRDRKGPRADPDVISSRVGDIIMFAKQDSRTTSLPQSQDRQSQTKSDVGEQAPPQAPAPSPFEPARVMTGSVIGTDLAILGERITIISQKSLQIDGDIRGDVAGKAVSIGPEGSVTGTISAETVEIDGGVRGAVRARRVTLNPSAQVDGEIVHETLVISEGAQFEGRVRKPANAEELIPNLDVNAVQQAATTPPPAASKPQVVRPATPSPTAKQPHGG